MANREQLRRLKAGVEGWNAWRQENPDARIDLRGANLKRLLLQRVNLSGADIRGTNFSQVNLTGANFTRAKAGLPKHLSVLLSFLAVVAACLSGMFSGASSSVVSLMFETDPESFILGWAGFLGLIILYILLLRKGANAFAGAVAATFAVALAVAFMFMGLSGVSQSVAFAVAVSLAFAFVGTFLGVFAFAEAFAITGASAIAGVFVIAGAFVSAIAGAVFGAFAGAFAVAGIGAFAGAGGFAITGALMCTFTSAYVGWRALAGDERYAIVRSFVVAVAATDGTRFREADLTDADFYAANLKSTDFRKAILTRTHWHCSKQLDRARCGGTILDKAVVRDLAVTHKGMNKSYVGQNLKGINLRGADLSCANLLEADISDATLEGAFLEGANLTKVQALRTRFQQATLTAACLEAWNIDSTTKFAGVICDHVYLLNNQQERRPNSGSFAPGEFTKLFQEVLDTVDLIFRDGVDWKAFVSTFRDIQVQNDEGDLAIQSIANKGDGVVVVKVQASERADKAKIHAEFSATYELKLQALEAQYRTQLAAKDSEIAGHRRENANMLEITKLLASRPINVKEYNQTNYGGVNYQNDISGGQVNQGETINVTPHRSKEANTDNPPKDDSSQP